MHCYHYTERVLTALLTHPCHLTVAAVLLLAVTKMQLSKPRACQMISRAAALAAAAAAVGNIAVVLVQYR